MPFFQVWLAKIRLYSKGYQALLDRVNEVEMRMRKKDEPYCQTWRNQCFHRND